jgi:hypothetical protein
LQEDPFIFEPGSDMARSIKRELPHFDPNKEITDPMGRLNINRDEAMALLESHQQNHHISEEIQQVFRK